MNKKTLICVTKKPFLEVEGFGKFKKGSIFDFPERIANHLLRTNEFQVKREVKKIPEKVNPINSIFKKRRS